MSKHTPGPWDSEAMNENWEKYRRARLDGFGETRDKDFFNRNYLNDFSRAENTDLLDFCDEIARLVVEAEMNRDIGYVTVQKISRVINKNIKKAKGE